MTELSLPLVTRKALTVSQTVFRFEHSIVYLGSTYLHSRKTVGTLPISFRFGCCQKLLCSMLTPKAYGRRSILIPIVSIQDKEYSTAIPSVQNPWVKMFIFRRSIFDILISLRALVLTLRSTQSGSFCERFE